MESHRKQQQLDEAARPERRASKRLADDLLRFEAAFDKLERNRMGLGAIGPDETQTDAPAIPERNVQAYLNCLDEAIRQLAEEFSTDSTIANLVRKRDTADDAAMPSTPAVGGIASASDSTPAPAAASLPRPNCQAFDARPCDASPMPSMISQVDTWAV